MSDSQRLGRGARGVVRGIDEELERVNRGLSGYDELLRERDRLLAAPAALTGTPTRGAARGRTFHDDIAADLSEQPDSWPAEIAEALWLAVTYVSAHLYRGKSTRID